MSAGTVESKSNPGDGYAGSPEAGIFAQADLPPLPRGTAPFVVFLIALSLRLLHDLLFLDMRVVHVGDSFNFLTAGSLILAWLKAGAPLSELFANHATSASGMLVSTSLVDRLLLDGPVYPSYLAFLELVLGIDPKNAHFEGRWMHFAVINAVVDSLVCLGIYYAGRLALGKGRGFLAALIFALYPAAIINTQHCYVEPFAYGILVVWICLVFKILFDSPDNTMRARLVYLCVGLVTGLMILTKPAFLIVPPAVVLGLVLARVSAGVPVSGSRQTLMSRGAVSVPPGEPGFPRQPEDQKPVFTPPVCRADLASRKDSLPAAGLPACVLRPPWSQLPAWSQGRRFVPVTLPVPPSTDAPPAEDPALGERAIDGSDQLLEAPARKGRFQAHFVSLFIGLAVVLGPWLLFTHQATGSFSLTANRVPTYNFFIGNYGRTDGWKAYPMSYFVPVTWPDTMRELENQWYSHPLDLANLELRKVPRLWAGVWNENQYDLPVLPVADQEFWHRMLLFNALLGAFILAGSHRGRTGGRLLYAGAVLVAVVLAHMSYIAFEPISRYNVTAIPAASLLAAAAIADSLFLAKRGRMLFLVVEAGAACLFSAMAAIVDFKPTLAQISSQLLPCLPWLDGAIWALMWVIVGCLTFAWVGASDLIACKRSMRIAVALTFSFCAITAMALSVGDKGRQEWWTEIRDKNQIARQDVFLPPMAAARSVGPTSFILVDLESALMLPKLALAVNGERVLAIPVPWLQLKADNAPMVDLLSLQSHSMGTDIKHFRQWWAFPVPTSLLRFGAANEIMITAEPSPTQVPVRIFGDYCEEGPEASEVVRILPSFEYLSWEKGFATYDRRDCRLYEPARLMGKNSDAHWFEGGKWADFDLSNSPGRQFGEYRIRLALVERKTSQATSAVEGPAGLSRPPVKLEAISLVSRETPRVVKGNDPRTMVLTPSPIELPLDLPSGSNFLFSFQLRDVEALSWACVSLDLSGSENGKPVAWSSLWQPSRIPTGYNWWSSSFSDIIPDRILRLDNLTVNVTVMPFPPDRLFMKRKQALRDTVIVRDANFLVLPPLDVPPESERIWLYY